MFFPALLCFLFHGASSSEVSMLNRGVPCHMFCDLHWNRKVPAPYAHTLILVITKKGTSRFGTRSMRLELELELEYVVTENVG